MIRVRNLIKKYGRFKAVDGLDFDVAPGEAVALWGPNGAGKTTVIQCILGLLKYKGEIEVAGHSGRRAGRTVRRAIGYVPQELAFYDDLRVLEAGHFFARLKKAPLERVGIVLEEVGLTEHRRKRVRELSGGMKQRLALGLALLADPPLLVLDELTSNLDTAAQSGFMSLLRGVKTSGKTILFSSHRVEEIDALADRVLVLEDGRLKRECSPDEFICDHRGQCVLKVFVAEESLDSALSALKSSGFVAARNGRSVHVAVEPRRKADPLHALSQAAITVHDFELAGDELLSGLLNGGAR